MSNNSTARQARKLRLLKLMLLQVAILAMTGCGGYGGNGNDYTPPPQIADAQFTDVPIEGLGFRVAGVLEGTTDASGKFRFAVGSPVQFFIGNATDRLVIGSATLAAANGGAVSFNLQDLAEVQNDADQYLGNLLNLLVALDDDSDVSNGIVLEATAQAAVAAAIAGGKTLNFAQAPNTFATDPVVTAALASLGRTLIDTNEVLAQFSTLFRQDARAPSPSRVMTSVRWSSTARKTRSP